MECLREIFNTEQLNFEHNFSEAGGDSLGAIQLITLLIEKKFTIEIVDIINPEHTLRDIARLLVPHVGSITKKPAGVWEKPVEWSEEQFDRVVSQYGRENIERLYDLTRYQSLFLTFYLAHPGIFPFHIQLSYTVQGSLDIDLCSTAFSITARRHPMLQTAVVHRDVPVPKQLILTNRGFEIAVVMDEPFSAVVEREFRRGFDFERDNLLRVILFKKESQYTHIIISSHHVISDGWSIDVLMRDFAETYRKLSQGAPLIILREEMERKRKDAVAYEEFVNYFNGLDHHAALSYFLKKLAGYKAKADLIHDYPNPQGNWNCVKEFLDIPQNIIDGIRSVARQCRVSPTAVYEGVFAFVLQQECGSSDVVFSSLSNERWYPINGIADIVGVFVNRVSARVIVDIDTSFTELFTLVQKQITEDLKYSYVDFTEVEKHCKYLVLFSYIQSSARFTLSNDVSVSPDTEYHTASEDIFLTIEATDSARLRMEYNPYTYAPATIRRFLNSYVSVLEYIITHVNARLSEVSIGSLNGVLEKYAIVV